MEPTTTTTTTTTTTMGGDEYIDCDARVKLLKSFANNPRHGLTSEDWSNEKPQ